MNNYLLGAFTPSVTPQSEPIPGSTQVANSASGYSFPVDGLTRLRRFLILGSAGGSYYASEQKLTKENAKAILEFIQTDGLRAVEEIVAISDGGRAPKNQPAEFALALAARHGDLETRKAAFLALPKVARIGTHLFNFVGFMESIGGPNGGHWSKLARRGVASWYTDMPLERLADQAIKYQSRDGWGHADLIRLAHPKTDDEARTALYRYMSLGLEPDGEKRGSKVKVFMPDTRFNEVVGQLGIDALNPIRYAEIAKKLTSADEIADLVLNTGLPREAIPTKWLDSKEVWRALLHSGKYGMPFTAMLRNLAKMTSMGLFDDRTGPDLTHVLQKLGDEQAIRAARVHPIAILLAMMTYKLGHGVKGSLKWTPVTAIIDALDKAFYLAFGNVEPSNVVHELWLDISGSMDMGTVAGIPGFTPRDASAAMALITAKTEPHCEFYAFTTDARKVDISPRQRLDDVLKASKALAQFMGGTDCAQPMLSALKEKRKVDVFVVYTDSETWAGQTHPTQALQQYRREVNPNAKLIVVGLVANSFTIADPKDAGMLDVCGFDSSAPAIMSMFAAGKL